MPTFLGTTQINSLKLGTLDVSRVMLGETELYSAGGGAPQAVPTRIGVGEWTGGGNASMIVPVPAGVQVGDWMIAIQELTTSANSTVPTGWTEVVPIGSSGTLRMHVMARQYQVGDTSWDFVLSGPVSRLLGMFIVRNAAPLASWVIGTMGRRVDQAATVTTTAAGINAPAGSLVLTCASERTTATPDNVSPSGATLWGYSFGAAVESVGAFYRECPVAETTPPVVLTYNNVQSSNGLAVQIAIPRATFSPLDIGWTDLYWASGPAFAAQGLGNGASVTSWPTETGTGMSIPLSTGTAPTLISADAAFNNKPSVSTLAAVAYMVRTGAPSLTQPWTIVAVGRRVGGNSGPNWAGAVSGAAAGGGLGHTGISFGISVTSSVPNDAAHLREGLANGAGSQLYTDGVLSITADAGALANTQRAIFARASIPTAPLTGAIPFVGFLNRALTTQERADLTSWSKSFYGTP